MSPAMQHPGFGGKKILAVGEDFALLATRAALLAKTNASVTCCNSAEFAQLEREQFDLVVLCYSLEDSVRQAISADVHRRWPKARLLLVTSEPFPISSIAPGVDAVTASMQPAQFVRAATSLLADSPL